MMGYNSSKFDKDAHYAAMTTKQLEELIAFWKKRISEHAIYHPIAHNELSLVQRKLAERIGRK
jgi:hypothetical protein